MKNWPKVSIIITAHNYGKYLAKCIESALSQNYDSYEVIVVNDGSTDNTKDILEIYKNEIKIISNEKPLGLAASCNKGIHASKGEYVIRLDADDYFDENILLIEASILDRNKNIHMVYPDYYLMNKYGEIIEYVRLMKVSDELKLLERSPLAAGAMYRRVCFDAIGGYDESLQYQEDYDFWIKFIDRFNVYNVNLPLMYYRRHELSMSRNVKSRMEARRYVKHKFVSRNEKHKDLNIIGIIPARAKSRFGTKLAIRDLAGKPVIAYTIRQALKSKLLNKLVVTTDDEQIVSVARRYKASVPTLRPKFLSRDTTPMESVLQHMLEYLEHAQGYFADIAVILQLNSPFREACHIDEAINTLLLHDFDSVLSVIEDLSFHWKPDKSGLVPVGYKKRFLRQDKETVYKENGAIYVVRTENIRKKRLLGHKISYIEMDKDESFRLESEFDFWVADQMIRKGYKK